LFIQFFQCFSGVGIIAYLNKLDAEAVKGNIFSIQVTSELDDDRLGVIG
jgi:hypothetical protein